MSQICCTCPKLPVLIIEKRGNALVVLPENDASCIDSFTGERQTTRDEPMTLERLVHGQFDGWAYFELNVLILVKDVRQSL